jgi:exosome complex component MTR3
LISAANGSAYLELETPQPVARSFTPPTSTIKLSCTVHGPKPLPRNATFSPNLQLTASVKFAPFATKARRGYVRDSTERDLGVHLENALKGIIIQDRWPKSAIDIAITILEGEDNLQSDNHAHLPGIQNVASMNVLAGSIIVASAALMDARIDCLDVMTAGVAACTRNHGKLRYILDPSPSDHEEIQSACVVAYLPSRDEITEVWTTGRLLGQVQSDVSQFDILLDHSLGAARAAHSVIKDALMESAVRSTDALTLMKKPSTQVDDVEMEQ